MKGAAVLSETVLSAFSIVISFILIVLVVHTIFSQQASRTYSDVLKATARDVSTAIDRAAALAGSGMIEQEIPKGLKMNLIVDYKTVLVTYNGDTVKTGFSGLMHSGPYSFIDPEILCIVKNRDDRRVMITDKECSCNPTDDICDPECVVNKICDEKCYSNTPDNVCNSYCVKNGDGVCDPDCYQNEGDGVWDEDCKNPEQDEVCDPDSDEISDGVCDPDCFSKYNRITGVCDPDCKPEDENGDGLEDEKDGICYSGCVNTTENGIIKILPDGVCDQDCNETDGVCDPDCNKDPDCEFKCADMGESCADMVCCPESGATCCPGTNLCAIDCCGNGACETRDMWGPGNKTKWETSYSCCEDCVPCMDRPPNCETRVDKGGWTGSFCYHDVDQPILIQNTIEVCSEEAQVFLDRRNWDIKEVAKTIKSPVPEGWGFDVCRYMVFPCSVQTSSQTITANEELTIDYFKKGYDQCACRAGCGDAYVSDECCGIGFCADHAAGVLSILRTLGVPADHVYSVFTQVPRPGGRCGRHAFVVYYCDPSLDENLKLEECEGHWGGWLRVDATSQVIGPLSETPCIDMCLWWNDKGPYPETEGYLDTDANGIKHGKAIPDGVSCANAGDPVCNNLGVACEYQRLCDLLGIKIDPYCS